MSLDTIFRQLEARLAAKRTYKISPDSFLTPLQRQYEHQQMLSPTDARKKPNYRPRAKQIDCSDMCIRGPGGQAALAAQWGVTLPADYLEFCSRYSEYILAGKVPIRINRAEEVGDSVESLRLARDIDRSTPVRIWYFSEVVEISAGFAFRWNENYSKRDIVYSWDYGDIAEPELLGKNGNHFKSDATFTDWLHRMLKTDGHPVFPGKRKPTSSGWIDQDRVPLVQIE